MRRDLGPRADPDALQRIACPKLDPVRFVEPVEMRRNIDRCQIDGARLAAFLGRIDTGKNIRELARPDAEIHLHFVVVEQPPVVPRRADRHFEGPIARMVQ